MPLVQSNSAAANTAALTATGTFPAAATAGNVLLFVLASDAYASTGPPSGWTESAGARQQTFLGHYVWWKVAAGGETSVSKSLTALGTHCWITAEYSGLTGTLAASNGQLAQSSGTSYTTPSIATTGGVLFAGSIAGSRGSSGLTDLSSWLNTFVEVVDVETVLAAGTRDIVGLATREVTVDGSYSTGATYNASAESRTGIVLGFAVASTGGAQTVSPSGIGSGEAFGTPTVTTSVAVFPSSITSGEALGSPTVSTGLTISPGGIGSSEAFGAATVAPGAATVAPGSIASAEVFGSPVVSSGGATIAPSGITSGEAFGTPTLTTGPVAVSPASVVSGEQWGTPSLARTVHPAGIPTAEVFGSPQVTVGAAVLTPVGIASAEVFGTATVTGGQVAVTPLERTHTVPAESRTHTVSATTRTTTVVAESRTTTVPPGGRTQSAD